MMYTVTLSVTFLTIVSTYRQTWLEGGRLYLDSWFYSAQPTFAEWLCSCGGVCEAAPVASCDGMMGVCKIDFPKLSIPEPLETA